MPSTEIARYFNPFWLTTYVLILYTIGHTWGALLSTPQSGAGSDAVLSSMRTVHFDVEGFDRSWYGFYFGFGLMDSIFFLFSAFVTWFLGGLDPQQQRALTSLTGALFITHLAGVVLVWSYFFTVPGIFQTAVAALLGFAWFKSMRSALPPPARP